MAYRAVSEQRPCRSQIRRSSAHLLRDRRAVRPLLDRRLVDKRPAASPRGEVEYARAGRPRSGGPRASRSRKKAWSPSSPRSSAGVCWARSRRATWPASSVNGRPSRATRGHPYGASVAAWPDSEH